MNYAQTERIDRNLLYASSTVYIIEKVWFEKLICMNLIENGKTNWNLWSEGEMTFWAEMSFIVFLRTEGKINRPNKLSSN